jgi:hypothetical protein
MSRSEVSNAVFGVVPNSPTPHADVAHRVRRYIHNDAAHKGGALSAEPSVCAFVEERIGTLFLGPMRRGLSSEPNACDATGALPSFALFALVA